MKPEMDEVIQKRLEVLFGNPNLKFKDVVIAVGDKEIQEEIRNRTELKDKLEEIQGVQTVKEMKEEIEKHRDDFDQIMEDMEKMRYDQIQEHGRDKLRIIRRMIDDISSQVEEKKQTEANIVQEIEEAVECEKKLKEDLHIAKNKYSLRMEKAHKGNQRTF